jgi:hypothetical protein
VYPTTFAELARVVKKLGQDGERVQVLMVTVDPERDQPQVLKQAYSVDRFGRSPEKYRLRLSSDMTITCRCEDLVERESLRHPAQLRFCDPYDAVAVRANGTLHDFAGAVVLWLLTGNELETIAALLVSVGFFLVLRSCFRGLCLSKGRHARH